MAGSANQMEALTDALRSGTLTRAEFVRRAAALGMTATAAAALAHRASAASTVGERRWADRTIRVQVWPGSYEEMYRKYVFSPFSKTTGAKIETVRTNEFYTLAKVIQEVKSGRPKLDMSVFLPSDVIRGGQLDLFERIPSSLANLADLQPFAKSLAPYGVGYLVYTYAFGKHTGIAKTKGIDPKRWRDLWNPRLEKSIMIGEQTVTYTIQSINLMLHGKLWPVQKDAWEWLKKLSPNIHSLPLDPAEMQNLLARNEAQVAVLFDGRIWTMQDAGVPVRYVIPQEGLYANLDYFSIPRGTPNRDLAFDLLNFALEPASQRAIGIHLHYGPTNRRVRFSGAAAQRVVWRADQLRKLKFENAQYVASKTDEWTDRWNEWRASL